MQKYKLLNNIFGWATFIFAAVVYTMTMESSGSFWDCGEFVSGCFKQEVVHPPGSPWFLILGRIFSLFTGADPLVSGSAGSAHVAQSVNFMSALMTAGAVLFTFWTVTALARKWVFRDGNYTNGRIITVIGAGLIAATSCTFLDSLWFSAVEGEVYATSQFFQSFIFWAIMKWDADDSKYADHWLILIAYMTGVSIGVHLLSLLALPAIALVFYYKKSQKTTFLGWLMAVVIGFMILGFYMKYIISYTLSYMAGMDRFFVNNLSMPFNSGVLAGAVMIVILIAAVLRYTHTGTERDFNIAMGVSIFYVFFGFIIADTWAAKFIRLLYPSGLWLSREYGYEIRRYFNIGVLCIAFSYIGYLSYLMVPIRSAANPPINMNRPVDPFSLKGYVDREQYGDRPLVWGPDYTAANYDIIDYTKTGERWAKDAKQNKYVSQGPKQEYKFVDDINMLFPRMGFYMDDSKKSAYRSWLRPEFNVTTREHEVVKTFPSSGQRQAEEYAASLNKTGGNQYYVRDAISFKDNVVFFFKYQIGYMYFRYFMWNLAGKQDDIQGTYQNDNGRWISGIPFIDNSHKFFTPDWPQENLSKTMLKNKARNKFYMIPFMLGLVGLIYTFFKNEKTFWILLVFFGTTGILQIIYQNEPPIEPRDRDYATACSFLAYTMWIAFGVIALVEELKNRFKLPEIPASLGVIALCASAPILMGSQGWDDHTRHGRYASRDFAIDYLQSCAPNAVLFTQGDNDTYPLWYAQEVEGVRPDIRIINLSLLGVDWYIDQLRYKMNEAAPLKLSFTPEQYVGNNRDVTRYKSDPRVPEGMPLDLKRVMKFIASDDPHDKVQYQGGESENFLPTKIFFLDVDTNKVKQMNMLAGEDYSQMVPRMQWSIENGTVLKNDLMTLDIVANNFMDRPIYFAVSVAPDAYMGLEKYFQLEGLSYRVVPKLNQSGSPYSAPVRTDAMYENMMKKFKFAGIKENPNIYLDENILRMTVNIRGNFGRLAESLLAKGEKEKAVTVIDYSLSVMPADKVPHSVFDVSYPELYFQAGQKEKGEKLLTEMFEKAKDELNYYKTVYAFVLNEARESEDMGYVTQLQQGAFMERREVREQLYIMQQLSVAAKKYDTADFSAKIDKDFNEYRMAFVKLPPNAQQPNQ